VKLRGLVSGTVLAYGLAMLVDVAHAGDAGSYYPKRSWGSFNNGEMNTSLLVFRDMNRNGVYDLGDRQMSHVAVELEKPDGDTIMAWTNVSGFANFKMSVVHRDLDVVDPGAYAFRVVPPPGFSVTTGNVTQASSYAVWPGSPGDMIALETTHPVGLAADLTISGVIPAGARVSATGPGGEVVDVDVAGDGRFSLAARPGDWVIEVLVDGVVQRRTVTVGSAPVVLSAFSGEAEGGEEPLPVAHVVGFDDFLTSSGVFEVPSGYGGLDWYNLVAMHQRFTE